MNKTIHVLPALACALFVASCTMKDQEAPPLTGPSGFGTSVSVSASPDVLQQDGSSQSVVTALVYGPNGQPLANVSLTAEVRFEGQVVDFGRLSARSIVTNAAGMATLIYTAPQNAGAEAIVGIAVTPVGTNFGSHQAQTARIRLVPTGLPLPPIDLVPAFTFESTSPAQGQTVVFDAQESRGNIVQYRWDFGDGSTASGVITSHAFDEVGSYIVRLTVVDPAGRTRSISKSISVGQSDAPIADFAFSPSKPQPNDEVRFNASASTASAGRRIVSYVWDFGDGASAAGVQVTRQYTQARTYNVTLTVTDDIGRTATVTKAVEVAIPDDDDGGDSPN
jgi:PKD repeat protein